MSNQHERLKLVGAGMGLCAALLLAAWLLGYFQRDDLLSDDPAVANLQRAMQRVDARGSKGPRADADLKRLIKQYNQLSPAQQAQFGRRKMLMYLPEQERQLSEFFAQPEAEQRAQIDREIDEMEVKLQHDARKAGTKASGGAEDPQRIMAKKQAWAASASPELRDMMDRRVRMINQRREERGLEPW